MIGAIKNDKGKILKTPEQISEVFRTYYQDLYRSKILYENEEKKATGGDGLPFEIYKEFGQILLLELRENLGKPIRPGWAVRIFGRGYHCSIPKERKDLLLPESYRPIALLNKIACKGSSE